MAKEDQDNRQLASINDNADKETLELGSQESREEGTAYQFVSEPGRKVASASGPEQKSNNQQKASAGRDPEYYYQKETPDE